MRYEYIMSIT